MTDIRKPKSELLEMMRQRGYAAEDIEEAERRLPDTVDIRKDSQLLSELGLGMDEAVNERGGSAW